MMPGAQSSPGAARESPKIKGLADWGSHQLLESFSFSDLLGSDAGPWPVCQPRASFADAEQGQDERKRSKWLLSGDPRAEATKGNEKGKAF